jgi:hypothetical protein
MTFKRLIAAVIVVTAASVFVFTVNMTVEGWGGCSIFNSEKYGPLAQVDMRGFLRPLGRLNIETPGDWKIVVSPIGPDGDNVIIKSGFALTTLKSLRFTCEHGDKGKPNNNLKIMKGDEVIYLTSYHRTRGIFGLYNPDLRFVPVARADEVPFRLILDSLPQALQNK